MRCTITACDYPANTIEVEGIGAEGLQDRFVRIFTDNRSSTYRILAAEEIGEGKVRLQLDQTNQLFEALITGFEDGRLKNATALSTWTAREEDDELIPFRIWNRDAALVSEDAGTVRTIDAVPHGRTIYLQDNPPAGQLEREFTDTNGDGRIIAHAYDYAIGARVELPRLSHTD